MGQRRHDIDWLRVLATHLLFVFHPALVFSYPPYLAVHPLVGIGSIVGYVHQIDMPLFFHYPPYYHLKNGELSLNWVTGQSLAAMAGFCLVVLVWGLAARFLSFGNRTLRYLNESTLPVYVLHHLPVIAFAYLIVQMRCGIGVKLLMMITGSLAATMLIYHFIIRPNPTLRFLFGAKSAPSRAESTILSSTSDLAATRD